ncbi:MAG TPA: cadherin repeat domain-containing protein, partial [Pirellulales bacterium]|nr:cadherin repeat domain-containing protein [Pirellulales bacterium]
MSAGRGSVRPLSAETLEQRHLLSGVTLITHGHTGDTAEGGWIREMGAAMMQRAADATPATPAYTEIQLTVGSSDGLTLEVTTAEVLSGSTTALDDLTHSGEIVVYLDWNAAQSLISAADPYNTVFVSAAVVPYLTGEESITGLDTPLTEQPMHLLGHSRGGSLVGVLAEDLGSEGVFVDQVSYFDPHPLEPGDYPVWESTVPQNVLFADSIWRTDGIFGEIGDFDGAHIAGSYDGELSEELLGGNEVLTNVGYFHEHLDVHLWYHGTIPSSETPVPNDGTVDVPLEWYGGTEPERLDSGFAFSRIAGGERPAEGLLDVDDWSANRAAIDFSNATWPSLFNLANSGGSFEVGESIPIDFDYHDNDSDGVASFFLDTDQNPYNTGAIQIGGGTLLTTGGATGSGTESLNTAAASAGTYFLSGRMQDAAGRTRYAYAPTAIELTPNGAPVFADATFIVPENSTDGTLVGTLVATDPDGDALTYSISSNVDPDNDGTAAFRIEGDQLLVNDIEDMDYALASSLVITASVTDAGLGDTAQVTINLTDLAEGSISGSKWHDVDGNQLWDTGELALSGWTIYIDANENGALDSGEVST